MQGHEFLKKMGRTKLRPGGGVGTKWLFDSVAWTPQMKVLEVACNQGDNIVTLHNEYSVKACGIDHDEDVVQEARANLDLLGFDDLQIQSMDAMDLKFEDESFDVVINEAMLTMYPNEDKLRALSQYHRILKNGGYLLTHDVFLRTENEELRRELSRRIKVSVYPQTIEVWKELLTERGFAEIQIKTGPMALLDKKTLIKDEGMKGTIGILRNAMKAENREFFFEMKDFFQKNKDDLGYILIASRKRGTSK